jgi:hypothetical protein
MTKWLLRQNSVKILAAIGGDGRLEKQAAAGIGQDRQVG